MRRPAGFTLIELLIAIAIVAVIGVMALGGLNIIIQQQEVAQEQADRWGKIQFAMRLITQDMAQIHPRPIRIGQGEDLGPAVSADARSSYPVEFSRGGWSNPAALTRGTVQRVAYELEDDTLYRIHWAVVDRTLSSVPVRNELLDGLEQLEIRFFSQSGQWQTEWPPLGTSPEAGLTLRPRAVEVALYLEDLGKVWRLVEVRG